MIRINHNNSLKHLSRHPETLTVKVSVHEDLYVNLSRIPFISHMHTTYARYIRFFHGCLDYRLILKSELFNRNWYLTQYRDVAATGINPAWHYAHFGWREGRDPGPDFSTHYYLNSNPEIRKADINPLLHYEKYGKTKGQLPKPHFSGLKNNGRSDPEKPEGTSDTLKRVNYQTTDPGTPSQNRSGFIGEAISDSLVCQIFIVLKKKITGIFLSPTLSIMKTGPSLMRDGFQILKNSGLKSLVIAAIGHIKNRKKPVQNPFSVQNQQPSEDYSINPSQFLPVKDKKIVVHAHVYYIDLFDEICEYLQNIPTKFTLLISVTQSEHEPIITEKAKELSHLENIIVRVVENRGRDIAPFLVEFGPTLRNFDYICHIHTKKSLFSGREQSDWRQYLFDRVLGSQNLVNAIFTAFQTNLRLGIIYPEIYPPLAYSACTWLSNKRLGSILYGRLNIRFDPDIYFDFPTGSMFWIKKEALEPLLDLNLKITDFPEETGQTDGTLQHALERCFVVSGQSKGFHHAVMKDPGKLLFCNKSSKNIHQYLGSPFTQRFMLNLPFSRVVSFDLFDTLLIRPFATPHMVFSYLEERISREYGINQYKELRHTAERIAREKKNYQEDVKISEIYSVLSELAGIDPNIASELLNLEVSTELHLLTPRKETIEAAKKAKTEGKRLILISDTYFEKTHIEKILNAKGIDFFDKIYLSCEIGKRKDRGDLWDYIIECEGLTPETFMHVGDNEETDLQRIGDKGYTYSVHVMRPTAMFQLSDSGSNLWATLDTYNDWRENLMYGKFANAFCSDPNDTRSLTSPSALGDPRIFGYIVFGPIVFNFINWLIKTTKETHCDHLWFLAREGCVLNAAYTTFINHPALSYIKQDLPNSSYFLCSRRSVIFSSLKTEEDIHKLLDKKFEGSLRDFFTKKLGLNSMSGIDNILGSDALEQKIVLPEDYFQVFNSIKSVFGQITGDAEKERELFIKYCDTQGFDRNKKIGVVDIGYSGTIQQGLMDLLGPNIGGYYFITSALSKKFSPETIYKACFGEFLDPFDINRIPLFKYSLLLESVMTGPNGQLIRFDSDPSGEVIPIYKEKGKSQTEFSRISQIHDGILQFITEMINEFGSYALKIEFPEKSVQICYEQVVNGEIDIGPLKNSLFVEDDYTGMGEISPIDLYSEWLNKHKET